MTSPICLNCERFRPGRVPLVCEAFPDGIPTPILLSEADHREPFPGDRGLRFEPKATLDANQ